jgi:hypothetical protein
MSQSVHQIMHRYQPDARPAWKKWQVKYVGLLSNIYTVPLQDTTLVLGGKEGKTNYFPYVQVFDPSTRDLVVTPIPNPKNKVVLYGQIVSDIGVKCKTTGSSKAPRPPIKKDRKLYQLLRRIKIQTQKAPYSS